MAYKDLCMHLMALYLGVKLSLNICEIVRFCHVESNIEGSFDLMI